MHSPNYLQWHSLFPDLATSARLDARNGTLLLVFTNLIFILILGKAASLELKMFVLYENKCWLIFCADTKGVGLLL